MQQKQQREGKNHEQVGKDQFTQRLVARDRQERRTDDVNELPAFGGCWLKCFSARKHQNSRAAQGPADKVDRVVFNSDREAAVPGS
jgi:hypothetical protein